MFEKILDHVRDYVSAQGTAYDSVLISHINGALFTLLQLGVLTTYVPVTVDTKWTDLVITNPQFIEIIKIIISLRVKVVFDSTASQQTVLFDQITEYESRLIVATDIAPLV